VSYAEQFQGMYALTRGLVSVFALAFVYWLGWAAAIVKNRWIVSGAILVMGGSVLILMNISAVVLRNILDAPRKRKFELAYAATLLISFLTIGYVLGVRYTGTRGQSALLAFLAAWAFIASLRAYGAYNFFAGRFASTVWRDYLAYNVKAAGGSSAPDEEQR
jgi:predicted Co/Zn/Cd cation transporter (cation efflux family)